MQSKFRLYFTHLKLIVEKINSSERNGNQCTLVIMKHILLINKNILIDNKKLNFTKNILEHSVINLRNLKKQQASN